MTEPATRASRLSQKQQDILRYLAWHDDTFGYPPSMRQIQDGCGISSTSVVVYNLDALEREQCIERDREVARAIVITDHGRDVVAMLGPIEVAP